MHTHIQLIFKKLYLVIFILIEVKICRNLDFFLCDYEFVSFQLWIFLTLILFQNVYYVMPKPVLVPVG